MANIRSWEMFQAEPKWEMSVKGNKQVCETTVAVLHTLLLADRNDMEQIAKAIRKIKAHASQLANA